MPEAWVYLLRCCDGSLYTGWTVDLERRLGRHRAGTANRYTMSRLPVELELCSADAYPHCRSPRGGTHQAPAAGSKARILLRYRGSSPRGPRKR